MPRRKTISIDELREVLGDDRTDDLLERLNPPPPTVKVDLNELNLAQVLYADPIADSKKWADTVPVVRRYFLERGQARRRFLAWIQEAKDTPDELADGVAPQPRPRQERKKITDPEVLERRRAALVKARAARSQKLREARQAG